jgi:hypothetical protein
MMTIRRRAATRSAHASCWTAACEIEPRWRLYCNDGAPGQGVALRSTVGRLKTSVERHDLIVRRIEYRRYHEGPAFTDDIAPFVHKRLGFQDEQEVRLLSYNMQHQGQLAYGLTADGSLGPVPLLPPELPEHICIGWNALDAVDAIIISPYATKEYEQRVRETVVGIEVAAAVLIQLSQFSERSSQPLF